MEAEMSGSFTRNCSRGHSNGYDAEVCATCSTPLAHISGDDESPAKLDFAPLENAPEANRRGPAQTSFSGDVGVLGRWLFDRSELMPAAPMAAAAITCFALAAVFSFIAPLQWVFLAATYFFTLKTALRVLRRFDAWDPTVRTR